MLRCHVKIVTPWQIWDALAFKATVSMSNIVGPSDPSPSFGGIVPLKQIVFFTPPMGTLGLFSNIITMSDRPIVTMTADARLVDKATLHKAVHEYFPQELRAIIALKGKSE
jgi:hypothetical protein